MTIPRVDLWEPSIPSDGLTVDTPLGPVDLVAVDRARDGHPIELNEAELTWLALKLGYVPYPRDVTGIDARRLVGEALSLNTAALSHRIVYRLRRAGVTTGKAA
ncbi:hypothetical protein [Catenulispora rubra]|uniref:hypothetical protein n=1 Tax=Catenulispora rubra TaxID=280293 RepID=UPI0018920DA2|nr:hypothetical protein [Catenulispora rubra]